jgi:hypothetical protein
MNRKSDNHLLLENNANRTRAHSATKLIDRRIRVFSRDGGVGVGPVASDMTQGW